MPEDAESNKGATTDEKSIYETPLFALLFSNKYVPRHLLHTFYKKRSALANYLHSEPGSSYLLAASRFHAFMLFFIVVMSALQLILQRNSIRGSGGSAALWLFLSFFFACRNSALTVLLRLPFGQHILYHITTSNVAIVIGAVHGLMAVYGPLGGDYLGDYLYDGGKALFLEPGLSARGFANWRKQKGDAYVMVVDEKQLTVEKEEAGLLDLSLYWSGSALLACMLLLWIFSREFIRRKFFNLFLPSHWVLFLAVIVFGIMHGALGFGLICMTVFDILFRFIWFPKCAKGQGTCRVRRVTPVEHDTESTMVELRWKDFTGQYLPGQFYFVCIPEVSRFEWHPLSVASTCGQGDMRIVVKAVGSDASWTSKLAKLAGAESDEGGRPIDCYLEGPYGVQALEVEDYSSACFFSGGHGVTPMMSIAGSVLSNKSVETITFIWCVRNLQMVEDCVEKGSEIERRLLLSGGEDIPGTEAGAPHDFRIYVTREADSQTNSDFPVYARGQRPNPLEILEGIAEKVKTAGKSGKCAVVASGPRSMLRDVRKACEVMNRRKGCLFHLHEETFEL